MSTVYRAVDTRLGRTVAIKVLHAQLAGDEPFLQRFQQEAEFAASLGAHPNIVDIYDIGQDGHLRYIVMELVEGRNLKDLIEERAPFSVPDAFAIGAQVASALDFAHKRGLIHRDVKPQNVLVTPEGVAKVTDFGIARSMSTSQLTRTGMVIGTVHYFSPEQAQGKAATPASDIYSLGIILYEMLTAHLPFDAENPIGIAMQHVHSDPPSPWDFNPNLPARAVSTVMRALEKDPERRYRDAAEFGMAMGSQPTVELGKTTLFSPLPAGVAKQQTGVYQRAVSPSEVVATERNRPKPRQEKQSRARAAWLALTGIVAALALGLLLFFLMTHAFGGNGKATPTIHPKPTPKHHRRPTSTPLVVVNPTFTPVPPLPTIRPTIPRPSPTSRPRPTPTPQPFTPTPRPRGPTPTPTPSG